jgi:ech hydrogenase subunit A
MVGGVSFLAAALLAISQHDAKRVLAYSTISNLGLIVACAGVGTAESLWAAIMLIVFHAIAKSLLFLSVGSTEYQLGSRNLEAMDGLYRISRPLAVLMMIGISGMFLAPFGMLVSKWAAMKAFLDSDNAFIALLVAFGSTATLFYWVKWMGKLIAKAHNSARTSYVMRFDEKLSLYALAALVIVACILHPLLSEYIIAPYIEGNLHVAFTSPIGIANSRAIIFMMCLVFIVPIALLPVFRLWPVGKSTVYMAGENAGDDEHLATAAGNARRLEQCNWYLSDIFGEKALYGKSALLGLAILLSGLFMELGGVLA